MFKRILEFYTKYFAVWVVIGGVLAYFVPGPFLLLKPYNKIFFGLTMFGIGVVLKPEDFSRIVRKPVIVMIGSFAQFTIMPFAAFALAKLMRLPAELAAGLVLAGCVPGAMASNVMSYVADADAAYSVSLTTVSTLLCPVITPLLTVWLVGQQLDVAFLPMFISVLRMVVGPLIIGLLLRCLLKRKIEPIVHIFPAISVTFIVFICALVIAMNRDYFALATGELALVVVAVFLLNVFGMSAGYGVGRIFRFKTARCRTLSIEIGMQNAGMGTVLALAYMGKRAAISTAIFVFMCIITASIMAEVWRSRDHARLESSS